MTKKTDFTNIKCRDCKGNLTSHIARRELDNERNWTQRWLEEIK